MKAKLSVIICTYNRAQNLKKCLASLAKQTLANLEVIIVDGGSTDNTQNIVSQYSQKLNLTKIVCRSHELAKTRDRGWRKAKAGLVAWIDDDVVASKNWAESIVAIFTTHPEIGGISGPTIVPRQLIKNRDVFTFYHSGGIWALLGKFWEKFFLEGQKYEVGKIFKSGTWSPGSNFSQSLRVKNILDVDYLEACNMSLRKKLVSRVGGFDQSFAGVGEWSELDLAAKVKKLGSRLVFSPQVLVHHYLSQSGVYPRRVHSKQRMENFLRYYFRHIFKLKPDYLLKFSAYLGFLNLYWIYKAIGSRNINWLGGCWGTVTGLLKFAKL